MKKLTFCARFQTIVDLGAIKLLKKWNAEIKKKDVKCLQKVSASTYWLVSDGKIVILKLLSWK